MNALRALTATNAPHSAWSWSDEAHVRALVREFLRCTPASDPEAALTWRGADGRLRRLTRRQLTARIQWLRPRMKRIVEQHHLLKRPRAEIVAELGCSMKTFERDEQEAMDLLAQDATIVAG
jgi:DNA-directed RNA polymerase specialized sigma24 family protein